MKIKESTPTKKLVKLLRSPKTKALFHYIRSWSPLLKPEKTESKENPVLDTIKMLRES